MVIILMAFLAEGCIYLRQFLYIRWCADYKKVNTTSTESRLAQSSCTVKCITNTVLQWFVFFLFWDIFRLLFLLIILYFICMLDAANSTHQPPIKKLDNKTNTKSSNISEARIGLKLKITWNEDEIKY